MGERLGAGSSEPCNLEQLLTNQGFTDRYHDPEGLPGIVNHPPPRATSNGPGETDGWMRAAKVPTRLTQRKPGSGTTQPLRHRHLPFYQDAACYGHTHHRFGSIPTTERGHGHRVQDGSLTAFGGNASGHPEVVLQGVQRLPCPGSLATPPIQRKRVNP